jgi:uncharacterized membrane protein
MLNVFRAKLRHLQSNSIYLILFIMLLIFTLLELTIFNTNSISAILTGAIYYSFSLFRLLLYIAALSAVFVFRKKLLSALQSSECFNKTKLYIFTGYCTFAMVLVLSIVCFKASGNLTSFHIQFGAVLLILLLGTLAVFLIGNHPSKNVLIIGMTCAVIFPLFTQMFHGVDEYIHFLTAFNISIGHIFDPRKNAVVNDIFTRISFNTNYKIMFSQYQIPLNFSNLIHLKNVDGYYPSGYPSIFYLPPALGLLIGRLFHFSAASFLLIGRFANLAAYVILSYFSVKLFPFAKNLFLVILFTPYLLLLSSTYSIDGIGIGFIFLYAAYCFNLSYTNKRLSYKDYMIIFLVFVIAAIFKNYAYIPIVVLTFTIPLSNLIRNPKLLKIMKIAIPLVVVAFAAIIFYKYYRLPYGITDTRGAADIDTAAQFRFVLHHPVYDVEVFANYFLNTMLNFSSGWLTWFLPSYFFHIGGSLLVPMFIFWTYVAITDNNYGPLSFKAELKEKILMFIYVTVSTLLICFGLYISFTSVGLNTIAGVQPRYFYPIIPFMFLLLSHKSIKQNIKNYNMIISFCVVLLLVFTQFTMIFSK